MNPIVRAFLNRLLGSRGERAAARYLKRKGLRVLVRGYRTPQGEIDLIARDRDTLVFVEVKTRRAGHPVEAVTPEKQRRIIRAAHLFLYRFRAQNVSCRFDVVAIVWPADSRSPTIDHYINAFESDDDRRGSR